MKNGVATTYLNGTSLSGRRLLNIFYDAWDTIKGTVDAVLRVVKDVNPKLGNCIQDPYDNFLDCFTVAHCFEYMRQVVEEWSKQCGNDGGCLMNDARGEFSSDRFLSMATCHWQECARTGNPEGCKILANCLTGGMKFYNKYAP